MRAFHHLSMLAFATGIAAIVGTFSFNNALAEPSSPAGVSSTVAPMVTPLADIGRGTSLDTLKVLPSAFDTAALKIAIVPVHVEYSKQKHDPQPYYRETDFQLNERDVALLQQTVAEAFTKAWFEKRHWQLVTDPATADIRLVIEFKELWLAAPLNESIHVAKTYTEESARFTLAGRIERTSDQQHLTEFSDKRRLRQLGMQPNRFERFSAVTFWRDMRRELDTVAGQLNRHVPAGTSLGT
jgi:hypothetical protein